MECLNCDNIFESDNARKRFCSGRCKVAYHRKNGKKEVVTKFDLKVLYNEILALAQNMQAGKNVLEKLTDSNAFKKEGVGMAIPKNEHITISHKEPVSQIESWKKDMLSCEDIYELNNLVSLMKKDTTLIWSEKNELERFGLQVFKQKGFS